MTIKYTVLTNKKTNGEKRDTRKHQKTSWDAVQRHQHRRRPKGRTEPTSPQRETPELNVNRNTISSRQAEAATKLISDTYSEDVHFTNVHVVVWERKLNNDVSEGWKVVLTIQRCSCCSRYVAQILATHGVVVQGRRWDAGADIRQTDDEIVWPVAYSACAITDLCCVFVLENIYRPIFMSQIVVLA